MRRDAGARAGRGGRAQLAGRSTRRGGCARTRAGLLLQEPGVRDGRHDAVQVRSLVPDDDGAPLALEGSGAGARQEVILEEGNRGAQGEAQNLECQVSAGEPATFLVLKMLMTATRVPHPSATASCSVRIRADASPGASGVGLTSASLFACIFARVGVADSGLVRTRAGFCGDKCP